MPDYQAYYLCGSCGMAVLRKHAKDHPQNPEPGGRCSRLAAGPCLFDAKTARLRSLKDVYLASFDCGKCGGVVIMPVVDDLAHIPKTHAGACGGSLTYNSSAPLESVDAYELQQGWVNITDVLKATVAAVKAEKDSQVVIRAYLIRRGFGFLSGRGGRNPVPVANTEFATFHPFYSIEEPGFINGQTVLMPRVAVSRVGPAVLHATWPDFVVSDGVNKYAIELKTPKSYVQAKSEGWLPSGGALGKKTLPLNLGVGDPLPLTVGTDIGYTAAWLLQYAMDLHKEAVGRVAHLPADYQRIFLIDLSMTGEVPAGVAKDLDNIGRQRKIVADGVYLLSDSWWKTYWNAILYFYEGEIVDKEGRVFAAGLSTYDDLQRQFTARTICTQCGAHIPRAERTPGGLCVKCTPPPPQQPQ